MIFKAVSIQLNVHLVFLETGNITFLHISVAPFPHPLDVKQNRAMKTQLLSFLSSNKLMQIKYPKYSNDFDENEGKCACFQKGAKVLHFT